MKKDTLFMIKPGFYDNGKGPYYCPYCAAVEGIIKYIPELEEQINIVRVDFPRPRPKVIELLGEDNQGCPSLVLNDGAEIPSDAKISGSTGRAYINDPVKIGKYLGKTFNVMIPH